MKKEKGTLVVNMTEGRVMPILITFALPMMLANLLQTAYSLADSFIVGRFVGAAGLAAVSSTGELITIATLASMGLGGAGQTILAQYVGRKDEDGMGKTVGGLLWILFASAVLFTGVFLLCGNTFLRWINIPEDSLEYAKDYYRICTLGIPFVMGYNGVSSIMRGLGESKAPLVFVAIASGVNVVLDVLFVAGFHMEAAGAAWATIIGQFAAFVASCIYMRHNRDRLGFHLKKGASTDRERIGLVLKLGIPTALQYMAVSVSMIFIVALINRYGTAASAANGVAMKLEGICRVVANSLSTAGAAMVSQCIGADRKDRCVTITNCVLGISLIYCAVCAFVIGVFPRAVFGVFTSDEGVLELAERFALIGAFTAIGHAVRSSYMMIINGIGNGLLSMILLMMDGVVFRIGLSLVMGMLMGMELMGFWTGSMLAGYVPAVLGGIYYYSGKWRNYNLIGKQTAE